MSGFFVPSNFRVQPDRIRRVTMLGGCVFDRWRDVLGCKAPDIAADHIGFDYSGSFNGATEDCDFRIVQIPQRYLYPEVIVMKSRYGDEAERDNSLTRAIRVMRRLIGNLDGASEDRPTFFLNYPLPQRGSLGRLMPRYDLRNPAYFFQRVNRQLSELADNYPGGHILDMEQSAAAFGRRYMQDDAFSIFGHGGMIGDFDAERDTGRLEPSQPLSDRYCFDVDGFIGGMWDEAFAMLRTLRATDRVKMVCIDLDDTLWRGVLGEADLDSIDAGIIEGWPLGFAEALMILKQRGILLAIISKNDAIRAAQIMERLFGDRLTMDDFAIRKVNWLPKSQNMAEAIREANILPEAIVYIDDNPVERAAVKRAFPEVRILDAPHQDWRRILLWSPETQVAAITAESATRTEMVQAQITREDVRKDLGEEAFLAELAVGIELRRITDANDAQFERAIELLNKTNQFNTTGDRWSHAEARDHFEADGKWWVFSAHDCFTNYGLVGVLVTERVHIRQFVMSCRVFGLGIEQAALAMLEEQVGEALTATLLVTERNGPCRHVYANAGWVARGSVWASPGSTSKPLHVDGRIQA